MLCETDYLNTLMRRVTWMEIIMLAYSVLNASRNAMGSRPHSGGFSIVITQFSKPTVYNYTTTSCHETSNKIT